MNTTCLFYIIFWISFSYINQRLPAMEAGSRTEGCYSSFTTCYDCKEFCLLSRNIFQVTALPVNIVISAWLRIVELKANEKLIIFF